MKTSILTPLTYFAASSALFLIGMDSASAVNNITSVSANLTGQAKGILNMIEMVSYLAGTGFGVKGALKLKEHNESKGQIPLSQPIFLFAVAGLLLGLPTVLDVAVGSTLGVSAGTQNQAIQLNSFQK